MKQYKIKITTKFKKQLKKMASQPHFKQEKLEEVINLLSNNKQLPYKYKNHLLEPKDNGIWECHVQPDVLLVYKKIDELLILILINLDSHSNMFR